MREGMSTSQAAHDRSKNINHSEQIEETTTTHHKRDRETGKSSSSTAKKKTQRPMSTLRYLSSADIQQKIPDVSSLVQYQLDVSGCFSPGSAYGNRVAIAGHGGEDGLMAYFASGKQVYRMGNVSDGKSVFHNRFQSMKRGKGGVYLPNRDFVDAKVPCDPIPVMQMRAEVQSLQISKHSESQESSIVVTDSYGRVIHAKIPGGQSVDITSICTMQPDDGTLLCEGGWTGGVVSPYSRNMVAVARHFPKDVTVFDENVPVRTFNTLYCPNDIALLSSGGSSPKDGDGTPLVAVAEGNVVTAWDLRIGGRASRVNRLSTGPYSGHLYTIAATGGGCPLLGAAGEDRDVCVWDLRTWKTIDRWRNCLKYEVTSLHFLESNPSYCVVSGMDYEVACGTWLNNTSKAFQSSILKQATGGRAAGPISEAGSIAETMRQSRVSASFRGTSRWIGIAKAPGDKDVFAGITSDKNSYIMHIQ
jgi:WD40 repeat protein